MIAIPNMKKPKECNDCPLCGYDERQSILFCRVDNEDIVQDLRDDCPLIEIVRCGECEYTDEYNYCKYSDWWTGKEDFCSHGIRRKESR